MLLSILFSRSAAFFALAVVVSTGVPLFDYVYIINVPPHNGLCGGAGPRLESAHGSSHVAEAVGHPVGLGQHEVMPGVDIPDTAL